MSYINSIYDTLYSNWPLSTIRSDGLISLPYLERNSLNNKLAHMKSMIISSVIGKFLVGPRIMIRSVVTE